MPGKQKVLVYHPADRHFRHLAAIRSDDVGMRDIGVVVVLQPSGFVLPHQMVNARGRQSVRRIPLGKTVVQLFNKACDVGRADGVRLHVPAKLITSIHEHPDELRIFEEYIKAVSSLVRLVAIVIDEQPDSSAVQVIQVILVGVRFQISFRTDVNGGINSPACINKLGIGESPRPSASQNTRHYIPSLCSFADGHPASQLEEERPSRLVLAHLPTIPVKGTIRQEHVLVFGNSRQPKRVGVLAHLLERQFRQRNLFVVKEVEERRIPLANPPARHPRQASGTIRLDFDTAEPKEPQRGKLGGASPVRVGGIQACGKLALLDDAVPLCEDRRRALDEFGQHRLPPRREHEMFELLGNLADALTRHAERLANRPQRLLLLDVEKAHIVRDDLFPELLDLLVRRLRHDHHEFGERPELPGIDPN